VEGRLRRRGAASLQRGSFAAEGQLGCRGTASPRHMAARRGATSLRSLPLSSNNSSPDTCAQERIIRRSEVVMLTYDFNSHIVFEKWDRLQSTQTWYSTLHFASGASKTCLISFHNKIHMHERIILNVAMSPRSRIPTANEGDTQLTSPAIYGRQARNAC